MKRLALCLLLPAAFATLAAAQAKRPAAKSAAPVKPFSVVEATIPEMRDAMAQGRLTSRELVRLYLERIATYEDRLNAVIAVNPNALKEADERDRERAQGKL